MMEKASLCHATAITALAPAAAITPFAVTVVAATAASALTVELLGREIFFDTSRDAVRFHVRRDTHPEEFYPTAADGQVRKFDDRPRELARNVNTREVPYDRRPGQAPRLDEGEIDALVEFLGTLTDGYDPASDSADPARPAAP